MCKIKHDHDAPHTHNYSFNDPSKVIEELMEASTESTATYADLAALLIAKQQTKITTRVVGKAEQFLRIITTRGKSVKPKTEPKQSPPQIGQKTEPKQSPRRRHAG
jgi:hypothetical protein